MARKRIPVAVLAVAALLLTAPASSSAVVKGMLPNCEVAIAVASKAPREAPTVRLGRAAVCLLNRQRVARGMSKLRINAQLSRAARRHSRDMVRRDYFDHTSPQGLDMLTRIKRTGYLSGSFRSWTVGENIAWGESHLGSPRSIVKAWMHSPGHRQNILNAAFREMGIGVIAAAPGRHGAPAATYTTTFGGRR
jgi:uncharacterized protein YkwD